MKVLNRRSYLHSHVERKVAESKEGLDACIDETRIARLKWLLSACSKFRGREVVSIRGTTILINTYPAVI